MFPKCRSIAYMLLLGSNPCRVNEAVPHCFYRSIAGDLHAVILKLSPCVQRFNMCKIPQTVLALRGSDGFLRDRGRGPGVRSRILGSRSCCKNRYLVTLTFAPLRRNRGSRAQTQKNSMVFVNFCPRPRHVRQAASDAADVCC